MTEGHLESKLLQLHYAKGHSAQSDLFWRLHAQPCGINNFVLIIDLRSSSPYGTPQLGLCLEHELELIQTQMTQKPVLRAEVYARALRASQNRKEDSV